MNTAASKNEIPMNDDELDQIMAELEAETAAAGTVPAPTAAAIVITDEVKVEKATTTTVVAPATTPAALDLPKGTDPLARQESNFVMPAKPVPPVDDPLPWEDAAASASSAPVATAPVTPAPAAPEPAPVAAKPALTVVPVVPAPAAQETIASDFAVAKSPTPKKQSPLAHSIDVAQFKSETAVSDVNLDKCMMEQNSLRAYYGELAARAEAQASRVKVQVEIKEAELYDKHRKSLAATGEKVTEKAVENAVKLDPVWGAIKNRLIEAETIASINKSLVESLKDRRDMIIQLGADRRDEFKGQARVMAERELRERASDAARR
jgi:hypothetical protein